MSSNSVTHTAPSSTLATFAAFTLTSLALASAWHVKIPSGIWLLNGLAAGIGIVTGQRATRLQGHALMQNFRRDFWRGVWLGGLLVGATQLAIHAVLLHIPVARLELVRLYQLLQTYPGPKWASPVMLLVVIAEEWVFRGAVTTWLSERFGSTETLVLSTLLYALPLLASGSWLLCLLGLSLGTVFTWTRQASQGLTVPLVSHAIFSLIAFGWLPVS